MGRTLLGACQPCLRKECLCCSHLSELPACEACSFEQLVIFDREGLGHGALTADNDQFRGLPSLNGIRIVPWDRIPTRFAWRDSDKIG